MKKNTNDLSVTIPWFLGFYNTALEWVIDHEIESESENSGIDIDILHDRYDFAKAMRLITEAWVDGFSEYTGVKLRYDTLVSPREYNFTTDRAFALMPIDEARRIEPARHTEQFRKVLRDWFTSRDGFSSFYSNDPDHADWQKPIEEWDHNELSALVAAHVMQSHDPDEVEEHLIYDSAVHEASYGGWKEYPQSKEVA